MLQRSRAQARLIGLAAAALLLTGCAGEYPTPQVAGVEERPQLAVLGASESAELLVNGVLIGPADDFSGERTLEVPSGTNLVQIRDGGRIIFEEQVFVSSGVLKTIKLP